MKKIAKKKEVKSPFFIALSPAAAPVSEQERTWRQETFGGKLIYIRRHDLQFCHRA
jgi:hypothetical protein